MCEGISGIKCFLKIIFFPYLLGRSFDIELAGLTWLRLSIGVLIQKNDSLNKQPKFQ